jgi:PAS domain S-box-containing protein
MSEPGDKAEQPKEDLGKTSAATAEERYRAFIENSSEGIWRFEVDEPISTSGPPDEQIVAMYEGGYLAECNDAFARMYGYSRADEIVGARLRDLMPMEKPENVAYLRAFIQAGYRLKDAESVELDHSGHERRFLNNLTGVVEGGKLLRAWGTQRDVTEVEKLLASYRLLQSHSRDIILLVDGASGRILEANAAAEAAYGYTREELLGLTVFDIRAPNTLPLVEDQLRSAREHGILFETEHRRKDGSILLVEVSARGAVIDGKHILLSIVRDISARRAGEQRLRDSEERFAKSFMANPSAMTLNSLEDGRYMDVNPAMLRATGFTREEVIGRTPIELGVFVDPGDLVRLSARVMETGAVADEELRLYTKDRRINTVLWSAERLELRGKPCVLTVSVDITARKAAEEELERRIVFEKQIVGIVSHDLKNPLATILLQAGAAARLAGLDDRTQKMLARIQRAAERGSRMVSDLLDFTQARLGGAIPIEPRPLNLGDVVRQALDELRPLFAGRRIELAIEGDLVGAWDGERLGQVVSNLASNALKYSPAETNVEVRVYAEGDSVVMEIHNEGEPIPEERLPSVFEPLQRGVPGVDKTGRSVGLGLYIVNQLVRAHGGSVGVVSARGLGTTFTVRLPRFVMAKGSQGPADL